MVEQTLSNWVKAKREGKLKEVSGKAGVTAEQMEISRLRAELARVKMDRDILHPTDEDLSAGTPAGKSDGILCKGPEVKYAFIERHRRIWPICVQCRVLKVSMSGFHQHRARRRQIAPRRHLSDAALLTHISAVYAEHRGTYGWPRIWRELLKRGIRVGKQRVQRLMQQHGIRARGKRRFRVTTTDSRHDLPIAPNLLNLNFTVSGPNQAWSGDITYIATEEGWLFLAVVIDLFSRKVVGWSMRPDMHSSLAMNALDMDALDMDAFEGVYQRRHQAGRLIFHSDHGSQYASEDFRAVIDKHGILA